MISIKITTFLALVWVQTQKLTHTNLIFLGWVELLKTHRITQPGLGYGGLGWVQPTPFRRVIIFCFRFSQSAIHCSNLTLTDDAFNARHVSCSCFLTFASDN
jgi:hypothetical protein